MDHLHEMAGTHRTGMNETLFRARIGFFTMRRLCDFATSGCKRRKDRLEPIDDRASPPTIKQ